MSEAQYTEPTYDGAYEVREDEEVTAEDLTAAVETEAAWAEATDAIYAARSEGPEARAARRARAEAALAAWDAEQDRIRAERGW